MGFFTSTEDTYNDIYIENAHRYEDEYGINLITLEAVQFGQEVFGDMVRSDIREQVSEDSFNEGVVQDIWEKVKAFFKKAWNKIKLFFKGLYAKILARMTSDNKAFYDKYHKDVDANSDALSMEVKYKPVDMTKANNLTTSAVSTAIENMAAETDSENLFSVAANALFDSIKENVTSVSSLKQELKDLAIGSEKEEKFSNIKKNIEDILKDGNKTVKEAQDAEKKSLETIKKAEKELLSGTPEKKAEDIKENKQGTLRAAATLVSIVTTYSSAIVDIIKFRNSQARKIYARAVSYKESYNYDYELAFTEADSLV